MVLHNLELLGVDPDQSWVVEAENTGRVASIFFSVDLQHTIGVGDSADGEAVDTWPGVLGKSKEGSQGSIDDLLTNSCVEMK